MGAYILYVCIAYSAPSVLHFSAFMLSCAAAPTHDFVCVNTNELKALCHDISVFLVTEARWGSSFLNQVCGHAM